MVRSSTIHAPAFVFLHATLSGSFRALSSSCKNPCVSGSWFLCHRSLKEPENRIKETLTSPPSPLFQTFFFLISCLLFWPARRSSALPALVWPEVSQRLPTQSCCSCQAPGKLLLRDNGWARHHYIHTHTHQEAQF